MRGYAIEFNCVFFTISFTSLLLIRFFDQLTNYKIVFYDFQRALFFIFFTEFEYKFGKNKNAEHSRRFYLRKKM